MRPASLFMATVGVLCCASGTAHAQPPSPAPHPHPAREAPPTAAAAPAASDEEQTIQRQMAAGLSRYQAGSYDEAIAIWQNLATALPPERGYKLDYNLGLAEQAAQRVTEAHGHFERFVRLRGRFGAADPLLDERVLDAEERLRAIERAHGAVHFSRYLGKGRAVVAISGAAPRVLDFMVFLPPGAVPLVFVTPDGHRHEQRVQVVAGEAMTVPAPAVVSPPVLPSPSPKRLLPVPNVPHGSAPGSVPGLAEQPLPLAWLLVGGSVTAASFALPAGLWRFAVGRRQQAAALGAADPAYADARSDYQAARAGYYASYALPALLAATTAVVVIVQAQPDEAASSQSAGLRLSIQGSAVAFSGRF